MGTGVFGRLKSALGRVAIATVLILAATVLQFWNEGRSMRQQRLLDDAAQAVAEVSAERPHAGNDGRLVYLRGTARSDGTLLDPDLDQPAEGLALRRTVEMYQWHEHRETREQSSADGTRSTQAVYRYEQEWADEPIDHRHFDQPAGHENPTEFPLSSQTWRALSVRLGGFRLSDEVTREIDGWRPMAPDPSRLPDNLSMSLRSDGRYLTTADGAPRVGDMRIRYERITDGPISLIAAQQGDWLSPWPHDGQSLLLVERGDRSSTQLIEAAEQRNHRTAWLLRLVGFIAMWSGFGMLLGPLARAFGSLPLAGHPLRWASATLSGLLSGLLSFVAIGSGFLFHRPWLLFVVLLIFAVIVGAVVRRAERRRIETAPPLPPPPPSASAP